MGGKEIWTVPVVSSSISHYEQFFSMLGNGRRVEVGGSSYIGVSPKAISSLMHHGFPNLVATLVGLDVWTRVRRYVLGFPPS
jgi:hypothetical protein